MRNYKVIDVLYDGYEIEIGRHKINNQLYFHSKITNTEIWHRIARGAIKELKLFMRSLPDNENKS